MKPYYQQDGITIYHGDCREVLPQLGESVAELAMCDPPYGETSLKWDRWPDRWVSSVGPAIKPGGSLWCFGSLRMFLDRRDEFAFWRFVQDVVWEKHNGSGFINDRFRRVHEHVLQFCRVGEKWEDIYKSPQFTMDAVPKVVRKKAKPAQWQGATGATTYVSHDGGPRLMRSVLRFRSTHGHAVHPTQKPEGLLSILIDYACPPGGTVLVPFVGSGSDLIAARMSGRKAIGVEADERYCEVAVKQLAQGILFGSEVA